MQEETIHGGGGNKIMLLEILEKSEKENKIISIYNNKFETNKFSVGYIINYDKTYYIMARISPYGEYDGYELGMVNDIYKIEYDGKYENKIKKLYDYKNQSHNMLEKSGENLIYEFLNFVKDKELVISVELCDSNLCDAQGYVKKVSIDNIEIDLIDEYGYNDGITDIDLKTVTSIVCDSNDETILKILSKIEGK